MGDNVFVVLNFYSKRDPQNLTEFLMEVKVTSKMNLFLILSRCESSYKSISFFYLCQAKTQSYHKQILHYS